MIDIPDFLPTVSAAWTTVLPGNPLSSFCNKLKLVKEALRALNTNHGNLQTVVQHICSELAVVQDDRITNKAQHLIDKESALISKLNIALIQEEHFWLQKSRIKWMDKGDGNNSFFLKQCKAN